MPWAGRARAAGPPSQCTAARTSGSSTASMTRSCRCSTASEGRGSSAASLITRTRACHPAPDKARGGCFLFCGFVIFQYFLLIVEYFARSILTSCIGKSGSEDDLSGAGQNGRRPVSPGPGRNGSTWTGRGTGHIKDEDDGFDDNYFRRRPKSFYFEGRRLCPPDAGDLRLTHMGEENHIRSMLLGYPVSQHQGPKPMGGLGIQYPGYSPALTRPEMFLSQDTLTSLHSVHTTQPNTPDLLLHRKAVSQ